MGALLVGASGVATADELLLADGKRLEGRLLAVGPTRIAFDGREGIVFFERASVAEARDADGRPRPLELGALARDPVAVVKSLEGPVRVRRDGTEVSVSIHGGDAVLREGDELRTGPYGRVGFFGLGGVIGSARNDAVVRFGPERAYLLSGKLRLKVGEGRGQVALPEGVLDCVGGEADLEHLRGGSRLICVRGRLVFRARAGYRVEIPRQHVLDVRAADARQPASLQASNTNAWPLRLEHRSRWVAVQPGERVVLLEVSPEGQGDRADLARAEGEPPPATGALPLQPEEPARADEAERSSPTAGGGRAEASAASGLAGALAGRVTAAAAAFSLVRKGEAPRRVALAEAAGLGLREGDELQAGEGDLRLEADGAHLRLLAGARLRLGGAQGGAPFALLGGEVVVTTSEKVALGVEGGTLGLLRGELSLRAGPDGVRLALVRGMAGARFGEEVRAEVAAPGELLVRREGGVVRLEVPSGATSVPAFLGPLEAVLRPGQEAAFSRSGGVRVVRLAGGAVVRFLDPVRVRVVPGPDGSQVLEVVEDGARVPLVAGTYSLRREGGRVVAGQLPPGVELRRQDPAAAGPPSASSASPAERSASRAPRTTQGRELALPNGALVRLHPSWGELEVTRRSGPEVVLRVFGGDLVLEAGARVGLRREAGASRLDLGDGRFVLHQDGGPRTDCRVGKDGRLRVEVSPGTRSSRTLDVEAGTEFDLSVRRDRYVLAYVSGQAVYVEPGQRIAVSQRSGLRTYVAGRTED